MCCCCCVCGIYCITLDFCVNKYLTVYVITADIEQCDGACLTIMKDKLLEIGINTASGDFVFSDVTTLCPYVHLYSN